MRRYGWVFTILIVAAFFIMKHRSIPYAPTPDTVITTSQGIRVAAYMKMPTGSGEAWVLARKASGEYVVNVYNRQTLVHVFTAGQTMKQDLSGTTYSTTDLIRLGLMEYQATDIHVNKDGRTGYIDFKEVSGITGNNVVGNAAGGSAGNAVSNNAG